ncbi:MAG: hypothetical protein BWY11_01248 [Firmicutes bacterium ADurb.Bin182]|nr:MAG: hypothetical protein BWY11_01248 [Firmicutes bacterium ADurb.Bin182]
MNKSIYSFLLADKVIERIDRAAYEMNMSRSGLVNRILAEYVSYVTPEQRMQAIFEQMQRMFDESVFRMLPRPSEAVIAMRTALSFKYSPSIRYSVELYRSSRPAAGILRVAARTQSEALLHELAVFFRVWTRLEAGRGFDENHSAFSGGHYARELFPSGELTESETADAIADYILILDGSIKTYFDSLPDRDEAIARVSDFYDKAFSQGRISV